MKILIMFILCFWLLPVLPACDEVTPDYPINVVDDGLYLMLDSGDDFTVYVTDSHWSASVRRPYDDDSDLYFSDNSYEIINHVHISRGLMDQRR